MKHLYKLGLFAAGLITATSCDYEPLGYEVEKPASIVAQEETDAYGDLKSYVSKEISPGFNLGAVIGLADYNLKGLNYRVVNKNFNEITPDIDLKHGTVVQADGSLNVANVKFLLDNAKEAGVSVFGSALASHSHQNATYLNSLVAPLTVTNPTFTNVLNVSGLSNGTLSGWSHPNSGAGISVISEGSGNVKSVRLISSPGSSSPEALQLISPEISIVKGKTYDVVFYIKSSEAGEGRVSFEGLNNNTPALDYTEKGTASPTFTTDRGWKKITFKISDFQAEKIKVRFDLGYKPNVTYYINVPTLSVYTTQEAFVDPNKVWLEAEGGTVGSLWDVLSNPSASEGRYVTIKAGNNSTGGATTDTRGLLNYNFTINTASDYALWARVAVTMANGADDSFFFRLDNGGWVTFNGVASNTAYTWYRITNSQLAAGNHTLTVSYREDGAMLDKLYLTKDGDTPTGLGATVPVATTVVLEKTAAEKEIIISEQLDKWISGLMSTGKNYIKAWDVVSEPMDDARPAELRTGTGRPAVANEFYWQDYLGKDYAVKAIQLARKNGNASDLLFINDSNLEQNLDKTRGLISYITYVESKGVKVDGIGTRMNISLTTDKQDIASMFQLLAATGKMIRVSELNVAIGSSATPEQYQAQKDMYKYVVDKYLELVPAKQRYGITIANPIDKGSATQHDGLWIVPSPQNPGLIRKPAYAGFAEGVKGLK